MNWYPILGLLALAYTAMTFWITIAKPPKLWDMAKIKGFRKVLGDRGTEIFFVVWGIGFLALGIWLFTLS